MLVVRTGKTVRYVNTYTLQPCFLSYCINMARFCDTFAEWMRISSAWAVNNWGLTLMIPILSITLTDRNSN